MATPAEKAQPTVTPKQADRAFQAASTPRDRALIATLWSSGLRVSELLRMTVESLDLDGGSVLVEKSKSGRPRMAPLDRRAVKAIRRHLRSSGITIGPLWPCEKGGGVLGTSLAGLRRFFWWLVMR